MPVGGEHLKFYCREILPCLKALFGDPELKHDLVFTPERHFTNDQRTCRIYNEMNTGDWWWSVQVRYEAVQIMIGAIYLGMVPGIFGVTATRRDHHSSHTVIRQNPANHVP
jgi:hypothetical protein